VAERQKKARNTAPWAQTLSAFLTSSRRPAVLFAAVAGLTGLFTLVVLGPSFILGTSPYWQAPNYDAGAHLAGWLFFKEDSWHFPLFETLRMNAPDGASILFTDSIPLVALIAKLLGLGLLGNWHYFGLFVAGSYVLNSVALLWVLRQLGVQTILGAAFAVIFACCTTLYNIQFESFFAHFFVIFSLGFYIKLQKKYDHKTLSIFAGMVLAASLVHPYLFAMSAALFVATLFTVWRRTFVSLKRVGAWFGAFAMAVAMVLTVAGYFAYTPTGYQEQLFAKSPLFALDLAAPFNKQYSVDEISTYLGGGFWLLAIIGGGLLWRSRARAAQFIKRHAALTVFMVGFLLFAFSTTLFLNGQPLLHIQVPAALLDLFEMFRTSKRFMLPLFYLVAIVAFVAALRQRSRLLLAGVVVALVVQVADTLFFVSSLHASARESQQTLLDKTYWKNELKDVSALDVYPSYSCLFDYRKSPLSKQYPAELEFGQLAAREHKIANLARVAKRTKDCPQEATAGRQSLPPDHLVVYMKDDAGVFITTPPEDCLAVQKEFTYGISCKK